MSLAFILNPAPSEPSPPPSHASSGSLSPPNTTLTDEAALDRQLTESQRFTRLPNNSTRSRARRDHVNFPPFENLTESALREVRRFGIQTVGRIQDSCRRIPYLAGKRDFQLRTGRDCFEVFEYDFKVPESDTTWTVMWDYKIGLVRTTPFFKCCNYSKTTSAKMLNNNPGLREISHSITGGAIKAQGYWMPYACARAVCANFCYNIAGALIPLFGPSFPADCTPPESPDFSRWIIDPAIIARSTREANRYRILYGTPPRNRPASADSSPRTPGSSMHGSNRHRSHFVDHDRHMRYRASIMDSPYTTHPDTDFEHRPRRPETPASLPSLRHMFSEVPPGLPPLRTPEARTSGYAPTSLHNTVPVYGPPRSWTAVNNQPRHQPQSQSQPQSTGPIRRFQPQTPAQNDSHLRTADPGLSAIPRSSTTAFYHTRDRYRYQPTAWEYISPEPQPPPQMQVQSQERGHPESQRQRMPPEPASLAQQQHRR
ncbi:hypothetical protein B0T19DRAFT_236069 [Cercophora scortea]|uniref:HTH APSES-type domain-containing protein n=1 Tax=Cercophora scortea TaxID=314031 RepID=A0AAE0MB77_9PEZI|nr:hypothetical protein B0T19DRAFT_236069 [Cercophora scortea]